MPLAIFDELRLANVTRQIRAKKEQLASAKRTVSRLTAELDSLQTQHDKEIDLKKKAQKARAELDEYRAELAETRRPKKQPAPPAKADKVRWR